MSTVSKTNSVATMAISVELNTKVMMFSVGWGTWKSQTKQVQETIKVATDAGYCPISCIYTHYNNNEGGEATQKKFKEKVVNHCQEVVTHLL